MARIRKDAPPLRKDGLQLDEHRQFQERLWTVERWAWVGFGLLVLAALAGLTGAGGPLSRNEAETGGGILDYPRIARWSATEELTVSFPASATGSGERGLLLSASFGASFQIETIHPEPERTETGPDGQRLVFAARTEGPASAVLHLRASRPGLVRFRASLDGAAPAELVTLVLP